MYWDEAKVALLKKLAFKMTDYEIAEEFKKRYPNENVTLKTIEHKRHALGLKKKKSSFTPQPSTPPSSSLDLANSNNFSFEENAKKVLSWLQKEKLSVGEISRRLDRCKETVIKILDYLREEGYDVDLDNVSRQVALRKAFKRRFEPLEIKPLYRKKVVFAIVSDTHLTSKYQQLSLLHYAYKVFDDLKVDFILHAGDMVEGMRLYKGQEYEVFLPGYDDQKNYVIENYPRSKNKTKTYIVSGSHDYSFYKTMGGHILQAICKEREDLVFRGDFRACFQVKDIRIEMMHPSGGIAYARSYKPQKLAENLVGAIIERIRENPSELPHILIVGHYHTPIYLPYMGMHCFTCGCFQGQTPYLKQKGFYPNIGFWIVEMELDEKGNVGKITPQYHSLNHLIKEGDY